jgi:hypothetical protein
MTQAWDLAWEYGDMVVSWQTASGRVAKAYSAPIHSACLLEDGTGVAVVEPTAGTNRRNAVIFEGDGTERLRLAFPVDEEIVYAFDSMYYIEGKLAAIIATTRGDFAAVVDPHRGVLSELRPSR